MAATYIHTCYRILDPARSEDFYVNKLGYAHVAFTVNDLEGTVSGLKDQGVTVTLEPKTLAADGHDYRIAFIEDPDGYKVELVQRGTMKVGDIIQ